MVQTLVYDGPRTAVTLGDGTELVLHPGRPTSIPAGHPYALTLMALGRLRRERGDAAPEDALTEKDDDR